MFIQWSLSTTPDAPEFGDKEPFLFIPKKKPEAGLWDWRKLVHLPEQVLARLDIAAVNLACGLGLPGAERIDVTRCLLVLDTWTETVKDWTAAAYEEFYLPNPSEFNNSEAYFRIVALVTALQRHCGVKYDPSKVGAGPETPFDFDEQFIHGVIDGPGGTCATLPVVYAAVGRRLGVTVHRIPQSGAAAAGANC